MGEAPNELNFMSIVSSIIDQVNKILRAVGMISDAAGLQAAPISIGLIILIIRLSSKLFNRNLLSLPVRKLKDEMIEVEKMDRAIRNEYRFTSEVIRKVEEGEAEGDLELLKLKASQLDRQLTLLDSKRKILSLVIMIKENAEFFNKLYGKDNWKKIIKNPEKIGRKIDKILHEKDIKDERINSVIEILEKKFMESLAMVKSPSSDEKFKEEPTPPVKNELSPPTPGRFIEISKELLYDGTPDQWLKLIGQAVEEGWKLKLPMGSYDDRTGYRNLMKAIFSSEFSGYKLRQVFLDKPLIRAVDLLKGLKSGEEVSFDPYSSEKVDMDNLLQVLVGAKKPITAREGNRIVSQYEFTGAKGEPVRVRKIILLDSSGKASRVNYCLET